MSICSIDKVMLTATVNNNIHVLMHLCVTTVTILSVTSHIQSVHITANICLESCNSE